MIYGLDISLTIFKRGPISTILDEIDSIGLTTAPMDIQVDILAKARKSTEEVNVMRINDKPMVSNYQTFFLNVPPFDHPFKQV